MFTVDTFAGPKVGAHVYDWDTREILCTTGLTQAVKGAQGHVNQDGQIEMCGANATRPEVCFRREDSWEMSETLMETALTLPEVNSGAGGRLFSHANSASFPDGRWIMVGADLGLWMNRPGSDTFEELRTLDGNSLSYCLATFGENNLAVFSDNAGIILDVETGETKTIGLEGIFPPGHCAATAYPSGER